MSVYESYFLEFQYSLAPVTFPHWTPKSGLPSLHDMDQNMLGNYKITYPCTIISYFIMETSKLFAFSDSPIVYIACLYY